MRHAGWDWLGWARYLGLAALVAVPLACAPPEPPKAAPGVVEEFPAPAHDPSTLPLAPVPPILLQNVGFSSPESALFDPVADVYLISNISGGPADADNDGFISKVAPDGTLVELHWIDGARSGAPLNAPKGMALIGETLFVADIDTVRAFDRNSGKALGDVAIPTSTFLNDLAPGPNASLYVSDTGLGKQKGSGELGKNGADALYVIDAQRSVRTLARSTDLGQPNGLWFDKDRLLVASTGGEVYAVSPHGVRAPFGKPPAGGLDGLVLTPGKRMLVSSWDASAVFISKPPPANTEFEPLITELTSPADIGYDPKRRQLIVPLFKENAVYIQELPGDVN